MPYAAAAQWILSGTVFRCGKPEGKVNTEISRYHTQLELVLGSCQSNYLLWCQLFFCFSSSRIRHTSRLYRAKSSANLHCLRDQGFLASCFDSGLGKLLLEVPSTKRALYLNVLEVCHRRADFSQLRYSVVSCIPNMEDGKSQSRVLEFAHGQHSAM